MYSEQSHRLDEDTTIDFAMLLNPSSFLIYLCFKIISTLFKVSECHHAFCFLFTDVGKIITQHHLYLDKVVKLNIYGTLKFCSDNIGLHLFSLSRFFFFLTEYIYKNMLNSNPDQVRFFRYCFYF